jgi:hypothetical protein
MSGEMMPTRHAGRQRRPTSRPTIDLIKKCFPGEVVEHWDDKFNVKARTMQYTLHRIDRTGAISEATNQGEGPKHDGFLLTVSVAKGRYTGPLAVPQTLHEPYWKKYVNAIYNEKADTHLWIVYEHGHRIQPEFHERLMTILGGWSDAKRDRRDDRAR